MDTEAILSQLRTSNDPTHLIGILTLIESTLTSRINSHRAMAAALQELADMEIGSPHAAAVFSAVQAEAVMARDIVLKAIAGTLEAEIEAQNTQTANNQEP